MVEGMGYLYPQPQLCYLQIAPPQLIYSSLTARFIVKLQGERCTNPTFSRVHIFYARMSPPEDLVPFAQVLNLATSNLRAS